MSLADTTSSSSPDAPATSMTDAPSPTVGASSAGGDRETAGRANPPRTWARFGRDRILFPALRLSAFYVFVCLVMMYFENRLVYPGGSSSDALYQKALATAREVTGRPVEEVSFSAPGGPKLSGWFVQGDPQAPVVLILHGNGCEIANTSQFLMEASVVCKASALLMDYRGFGRSEGTASEAGLLADGRAGRKWLAERCGVAEKDIILWGQSMGGAVAIDLAQDGARGLLTEYTFTSLPDAAEKKYFMLPVRWMMTNQMNSLEKIRSVTCPTYIMHGTADTLVPYEHSERLFAASGAAEKRHFRIEGVGHFTPFIEPLFEVRKQFFQMFAPPAAAVAEAR